MGCRPSEIEEDHLVDSNSEHRWYGVPVSLSTQSGCHFFGFAPGYGSNPCLARERLVGNSCTDRSEFAHDVLYICDTAQRPLYLRCTVSFCQDEHRILASRLTASCLPAGPLALGAI